MVGQHDKASVRSWAKTVGLMAGLAVGLAACGDLPKPFQHAPGASSEPLTRLSTASGIEVWPPHRPQTPDAPQGNSDTVPLADGLALILRDQGIPADTVLRLPADQDPASAAHPLGYALAGQIVDANRDQDQVRWTLFSPEGQPLLERIIPLDSSGHPDPQASQRWALDVKLAVEKDMDAPLTKRMAAQAAAPLPPSGRAPRTAGEVKASLSPIETLPPVALGPIEGFGDSRDSLLAGALKRRLTRIGIVVADDAPLHVGAEIMKEVIDDTIRLQVVWRLLGPNGDELGTISQANPVPAELLERQFPALAVAIAEGGADGLVALLSQLPPDRYGRKK